MPLRSEIQWLVLGSSSSVLDPAPKVDIQWLVLGSTAVPQARSLPPKADTTMGNIEWFLRMVVEKKKTTIRTRIV